MLGKLETATLSLNGFTATFSAASGTSPNVSSLPTNILVRSYPALDFRGLWRVLIMVPSARTIVRDKTHSRIVPYLAALVQLHPERSLTVQPSHEGEEGEGGENAL